MLHFFAKTFVIGLAMTGAALAQTPPANPNAPSNPAVSAPGPSAANPAPGANSFTEAQARMRIENDGFAQVSGLTKDADGVWRGMATKGGQNRSVAVDYQGNVSVR